MLSGRRLAVFAVLLVLCVNTPTAIAAQQLGRGSSDTRTCDALDVRAEERPHPEGQPTEIVVGVRVIDVTHIDDVGQSIDTDFLVRQIWTDPRLTPFEGCKFSMDQVWTPQIDIFNSGKLSTRLRNYVEVLPLGRIQYIQRYLGPVVFPYQAHRFPFDEHEIALSFSSVEYGEDEVILVNDQKFTGRTSGEFNVADWTIGTILPFVQSMYVEAYERKHSRLNVTLPAKRRTGYFIWKVMVPLTFIVAMSWSVFWLDPARFGPQIGLSATSMLTLIAFLFATQAIVPRLNYLTIMDKFVLGSTVLVFLALVEAIMTGYLIATERAALAVRIDRLCRWIFPAAFAALMLGLYFEATLPWPQQT